MNYVNISDICDIQIGKTPKRLESKYWGKGNTWVSIADMKQKYIGESKEEINDLAIKECNMKVIPRNTVIMSFKLSIGKVAITKKELYTNEAIAAFIIKDNNELLTEFLYYYLKSYNFDHLIDRAAKGKTLNKRKLQQINVPLIDLEKQVKIIKVLNKVENILQYRQQQIEALSELKTSIFLDMFGDPSTNPKGWDVCTFKDVSTVRQGLQIPIAKRLNKKVENSYTYITVQYLNGKKEAEYILNPKSNVICTKDDILMTRTGNTGMVISNAEGVFHNNFFLIDYNRKLLNKEFLFNYLNTEYIQWDLLRRAGTSTIPDLNHSDFYKIKLYLPPRELQDEFEYKINEINLLHKRLQHGLDKQERLYNSLLHKSFSGELFREENIEV